MNSPQEEPRGRSRFSKPLPPPPTPPAPPAADEDHTLSRHLLPVRKSSLAETLRNPQAEMATPRWGLASSGGVDANANGSPNTNTITQPVQNTLASFSHTYGHSRDVSDSSSTNGSPGGSSSPPDLPPKDPSRQFPVNNTSAHQTSPCSFTSSPHSKPEIWKRRSSDKSIKFPALVLEKSNGSTASAPSLPRRQQERPAQESPSQRPRSKTKTGPIPARPAPAQPQQAGLMGSKPSKAQAQAQARATVTGKRKPVGESSSRSDGGRLVQQPSYQPRPPTPEFYKSDPQTPLSATVLSPHTPPSDENPPPLIPPRSASRTRSATLGSFANSSATILPSLPHNDSDEHSETFTRSAEPTVLVSPQPKKIYATSLLSPQPSPPLQSPPMAARARHDRRSSSIYFPTVSYKISADEIVPAPSISEVHLKCYHGHQSMKRSRNDVCRVECMLCCKGSMDLQWKCSWCCLRACGGCMEVLSGVPGKDLRTAMQIIGVGAEE